MIGSNEEDALAIFGALGKDRFFNAGVVLIVVFSKPKLPFFSKVSFILKRCMNACQGDSRCHVSKPPPRRLPPIVDMP